MRHVMCSTERRNFLPFMPRYSQVHASHVAGPAKPKSQGQLGTEIFWKLMVIAVGFVHCGHILCHEYLARGDYFVQQQAALLGDVHSVSLLPFFASRLRLFGTTTRPSRPGLQSSRH